MRSGWQVKSIGELCDLATGGTPSRSKPEYFDGDIKWLVSGDIHQREVFDCEGRITEAGQRNSNAKLLPLDSVLIALNGQGKTRGTVALLRTQATCNQSMVSISPKSSAGLLPEFLYLNLHGRYEEIRRMTSDDDKDRRGLNMGIIKSISVPIPPIAEQHRLVGILDDAFEGITTAKVNSEQNFRNARALFESHLQSVFSQTGSGWEEHALSDLIAIQNGYAFKSAEYTDAGYFVIRISNVQDGVITLDSPRFIKLADKRLERFVLNAGDILISLTGNIGRVGILQKEQLPAVLNQRVARITVKDKRVERDFLFRFLSSRSFRERLQGAGHGAAQQNVSTTEIEAVTIMLPSRSEQRRITQEFEKFSDETARLSEVYERKIDALEALKRSLLHQAFSGQL